VSDIATVEKIEESKKKKQQATTILNRSPGSEHGQYSNKIEFLTSGTQCLNSLTEVIVKPTTEDEGAPTQLDNQFLDLND
jgi:hypothetical protein